MLCWIEAVLALVAGSAAFFGACLVLDWLFSKIPQRAREMFAVGMLTTMGVMFVGILAIAVICIHEALCR